VVPTSAECRLRLGLEVPVVGGLELPGEQRRHLEQPPGRRGSRLDDGDTKGRILAQTPGHGAPSRPGADDDVVVNLSVIHRPILRILAGWPQYAARDTSGVS